MLHAIMCSQQRVRPRPALWCSGVSCLLLLALPGYATVPAKTVVLTFDDSVKSHATVVAPLLKELGFHATFFVTEGFDFKTNKEDYMTWQQIRQLHQDGFEIGNHTRDHLGMTEGSLPGYQAQIDAINARCQQHGIPQPVSFAYPGNAFHLDGIPLLRKSGFKFARRGGSPEYTYSEGGGVGYEPGKDHPLLIPSVGDARPDWTMDNFTQALHRAQPGSIAVLQFHGVPDHQHPWVHTPPDRFRHYMMYLKTNDYRVLAMRDLEQFVDPAINPEDPMAIVRARKRQIASSGLPPLHPFLPPDGSRPIPTLELSSEWLRGVLHDKAQSPQVLSGFQSLFHREKETTFDAYDPDTAGASAGLNFEHIISGHADRANRFTPRHGTYLLHPLPDSASAVLVREARHTPWAVDSWFRYSLNAANAVDFEFQCIPRDASRFGERGYGVFFFANYMNDVEDPALHFRGIERENGGEQWIKADAPKTHPDYNGGGTYASAQSEPLTYDTDHNFKLNLWSYDYPRFTQPFYYGRAAHGMVFILMFDRSCTDTDEIRFSLFKFKLPKHPRPAWDFQYVIRKIEAGRRYGFKGRLIWKKWISEEDCQKEYNQWSKP